MITINLRDDHIKEHLQAIKKLRGYGFTDEQIQEMYDRQVEKDQRSDNNAE